MKNDYFARLTALLFSSSGFSNACSGYSDQFEETTTPPKIYSKNNEKKPVKNNQASIHSHNISAIASTPYKLSAAPILRSKAPLQIKMDETIPEIPECMMHVIVHIHCIAERLKYLDSELQKKTNLFYKSSLGKEQFETIKKLTTQALGNTKYPTKSLRTTKYSDSKSKYLIIKIDINESTKIPPELFEKFDIDKKSRIFINLFNITELLNKKSLVHKPRQQFSHLFMNY